MLRQERHRRPNLDEDLKTTLLLGLATAALFVAAVSDRLSLIMMVLGAALLCATAIFALGPESNRGFNSRAFPASPTTPSLVEADSDPVIGTSVAMDASLSAPSRVPLGQPAITRLVIPAIGGQCSGGCQGHQ